MDNLKYLFDKIEPLLPYFMASMAKTEHEKSSILKIAELCDKHGVPFRTFVNILCDLTAWEAEQSDV